MSIFFSFSDTQLGQSLLGNVFTEGIVQALWFEGNLYVWHGSIVLGHADIAQREEVTGKAGKIRVNQSAGDLSCTVRTEVIEDNRVVCRNSAFLWIADNAWNNKFIGDIVCIGISHCLYSIFADNTFTANQNVVCFFHTFPTVVAVHCVVTSHYRSDFANAKFGTFVLQLFNKLFAGSWRNVTTVHEAMNIYFGKSMFFSQFQQAVQMFDMAVYAAVGQQSHQMQGRVVLLAIFDCRKQSFVFEEVAILNRFCNAGQLLINDAASADVGVSNLGVAHLTIRQANIQTGCTQLGVRILSKIFIKVWLFCSMDGISIVCMIDAETIENH